MMEGNSKSARVGVIGAGNTGSQVAGQLARRQDVAEIVLCDGQVYTRENVGCQEIDRGDVGSAKAEATARRLRKIREGLKVTAVVDRVENVPWGLFRGDLIVGCVDSKGSRAAIGLMARRVGVPYVDVGIRADGLLARVDVYGAEAGDACIECGFTEGDYQQITRSYACDGGVKDAPATGASAALGGLAASLAALECGKILERGMSSDLVGKQMVIEAERHHVYVNSLRRNPGCRFDHRVLEIGRKRVGMLGEIGARIGVEGKNWITRVVCRGCGEERKMVMLQGRGKGMGTCEKCGGGVQPLGFGMVSRLEIGARLAERGIGDVGLLSGDVVSVGDGDGEDFFELAGAEG
jgi:molybdopterin/thiamine biosynthesis adenylyltransferase